MKESPALPIVRVLLRILIAINWVIGVGIVVLLLVMPNEEWILRAFQLDASPDADRLVFGLRSVAVLGLVTIPLNFIVLSRLLAIVETVRGGEVFVSLNAHRLMVVAKALLSLQLLSMVIGAIGRALSTPAHPIDLDAGFSVNGWLAVLLTFVLAQVFAEGARMRDDLAGTV